MADKILIRNVVASCSADAKIPLSRLAMALEGTEYEPEQFPGLVYKMEDPKAAALIFRTGKIICTGTTSLPMAKKAVEKVILKIRDLGVSVSKTKKIVVENIVASAIIGNNINLNVVAFKLENTEYEPEQFPGLICRLDEPQVVFLLFSSGKIICTGGKSKDVVEKSIDKLKKTLKEIGALK